jgi:ring-1,2-phenylacetyl-CoA epoxidase subunit PaaA
MSIPVQPTEDPVRLAEFEARLERGETIEPKDWMPERYRKQLIRMMSQHAHSEVVGASGRELDHPGAELRRKMVLLARCTRQAGAVHLPAPRHSTSREKQIDQLLTGKAKCSGSSTTRR